MRRPVCIAGIALLACVASAPAQDEPPPGPPGGPPGERGPDFGPPGGGPGREERKLVERFDADGDGLLNAEERRAARESLKSEPAGRGGRRPGPPGGMGGMGEGEPTGPGRRVLPAEVRSFDTPLY